MRSVKTNAGDNYLDEHRMDGTMLFVKENSEMDNLAEDNNGINIDLLHSRQDCYWRSKSAPKI